MAALDAASGRNVWVGIGKQTAFGTPVAPSKFFEVTDISGLLEEYNWQKSKRRVGTRFKPLGYKTSKKVPFSFTVEVNPQTVGLLLALAMGSDTVTTVAAGVYKHSLQLAENLSYFTLWASTDLIADDNASDTLHQVANCKIISMDIDATCDEALLLKVTCVGTTRLPGFISKAAIAVTNTLGSANLAFTDITGIVPGQTVSGTGVPASTTILSVNPATKVAVMSAVSTAAVSSVTVAAPVPSFPTVRSLYNKAEESQALIQLAATIGGLATFFEATEFHMSQSNGVAPDIRLDGTPNASGLREGDSEVTGKLKVIYNRNSFPEIKAFQQGLIRALCFSITSSELVATTYPYYFKWWTDKARYSGAPTSWDPDAISTELDIEVEKTTGYPLVEVQNGDSASYLA